MTLKTKWRGLRAWCWWTWRRIARGLEQARQNAEQRSWLDDESR